MAARRTTGAGAGGRESRVRSRQGEDQAQQPSATAAAEGAGMGMTDALIIITFVALVVGFVLMDKYLGTNFKTGMFFAG